MNKLLLSPVILLLSTLQLSAQQKSYREIWLFTSDAANASFITQKLALTDVTGLNERDIQVHEIVGSKSHQALFKKYKASTQNFTFILIGKDGGEKLRSTQPISKEKLYRTIDDMPMRKSEMKH
ncbi:MAG: DUF4174 domain-containing protein [Janthinobacterium lividum]